MLPSMMRRRNDRTGPLAREESGLHLEILEQRLLLSFIGHVDGDTLFVTQTVAEGNVIIDDHGPGGRLRVTDLSGTLSFPEALNASFRMRERAGLPFSTTIDFDSPFQGNFRVTGNTAGVHLVGDSNTFGSLLISGNANDQHINLAINADLTVNGPLIIGGGRGHDQLNTNGRTVQIAGRVSLDRINRFVNDGQWMVGDSLSWEYYDEPQANVFRNEGSLEIAGNLTINQFNNELRNERDRFYLTHVAVHGDTLVNLGNYDGTQWQHINLQGFSSGRNVSVFSKMGWDRFDSDALTQIDGVALIDLGDGNNFANFAGTLNSNRLTYRGGANTDFVQYAMEGNPGIVNLLMRDGNDRLGVSGNVGPEKLRVDFGGGNDTLDWTQPFDFDASFINWNGFNQFYFGGIVSELWETSNLDNILFDDTDNGQIRLHSGGGVAVLPTVKAVVTYLRSQTGNVEVDTSQPVDLATFALVLGNGDRQVSFSGSSNTFLGNVSVDGGQGEQIITLDENRMLTVNGRLDIDLKAGDDRIAPITQGLSVGSDLTLRGVNEIRNESVFQVDQNLLISNASESRDTSFSNNGSLGVDGHFNYFGGDRIDTLLMNGNESFHGNVFVDLGAGINGGSPQIAAFHGSEIAGWLRVQGGDSHGGNSFLTDASTQINGEVIVQFVAPGPHVAIFRGMLAGTYGTYRGGSDSDQVTFGAVAANMTFFSRLGDGADRFRLEAGTQLTRLIINFGPGIDIFQDEIGEPYPFATTFNQLP